jgi:dihydrofolate reductase
LEQLDHVRGDVAAEVTKLKQQDGKDLVIYGHGPLGETLLEHDLLDELQFAVHPLLVGSGALLFRERQKKTLKLVETKTLQTGSSSSPTNRPRPDRCTISVCGHIQGLGIRRAG